MGNTDLAPNIGVDVVGQFVKLILNVEPIRFPLTGIGRYVYELANQLSASNLESLKFLSGARFVNQIPQSFSKGGSSHGVKRFIQRSSLAMEAYGVLMPFLRSRALKNFEDHIYHSPNYFLPRHVGKTVATFHDLSPFTWAECHDPVKIKYLQTELTVTLNRADLLITDSEFVRQELAEFSGRPLSDICVVPLAAGPEFKPRTKTDLLPLLSQYELEYQGYSLFVGTIEPRKNLIALMDAYQLLPLSIRKKWPLILAGYHGWKSDSIHARIHQAEREGWAKYLGFVNAAHLPLLYSGARTFVFPSLYEGFGLPILEAMSSGVPVVCSNSSSLTEVAGSAALQSDPADTNGLSKNIRVSLEDESWREKAILTGLSHVNSYSWARCTKETLDVYKLLERK